MSVRLSNNCTNCSNLSGGLCTLHEISVSERHTCDSFSMLPNLKNMLDCTSCSRYESANCAHPDKASAGMLCASWAPQAIA
ncbi:hypothetical protein [Urechidicola croceus]|uniref:DUF1540 domain-containing protein n=1 Tax=Urechidicola croceus TaxID=1850246 RepID=A0A1D8P4Y4_9FLAO|nr:hypothetical protein [Urechidicola croceus]AOW19649.1 hypothetical protein LPB138_02675 [Urechidicola croceus]